MSKRAHHTGNTLSEYGVILGLVALVGVGALNLLGGSTANLFGETGNSLNANRGTLGLLSAQAGKGQSAATAGAVSLRAAAAGSNVLQAQLGGASGSGGGTLNADLGASRGSGGTNSTSVEGSTQQVQAVQSTLATAQKLQALADNVSDPALKAWYQQAADNVFLLAGSEANYTFIQTQNPALQAFVDPKATEGEAIRNIFNQHNVVDSLLTDGSFPGNAAQWAEAMGLLQGAKQTVIMGYGNLVAEYNQPSVNKPTQFALNGEALKASGLRLDNGHQYAITAQDVAQAGTTLLQSGSAPEAIGASLTSGQALQHKADTTTPTAQTPTTAPTDLTSMPPPSQATR